MASTTLPGMINEWWKRWPAAQVCIDVGKSGVVAIDCDVRHGDGPGAWRELASPGAQLGTTSGGEHHLYRADPDRPIRNDQNATIAEGVDVRGVGGMIIIHPVGYEDALALPNPADLTPAPEVIHQRVPGVNIAGQRVTQPVTATEDDLFDSCPRPARTFTADEAMARIVKPAIMHLQETARRNRGGVNGALNQAACALSHFVPEFFSVDTAMGWLTKALGPVPEHGQPQNVERFRRILDGREPIRDAWTAELVTPNPLPEVEPDGPDALALEIERQRINRAARRFLDEQERTALASGEAVDALRAELLTSSALDSIEDLEPLIDEWLYRDSLARIVGASGSYKTFVALDMALSVACKRDWFGSTTSGGPVLYVVAEGARGIRRRVRAWEWRKNDGRPVDDLYILPRAVQILEPEYLALLDVARSIGAVMVVLDTQARVTVGVDENSATDMGRVVAMADRLRGETGATVVLVHHTGYNGAHARGSTAVYGALQSEIEVSRTEDGHGVDLKATKQKDHDMVEGHFRMEPVLDSLCLINLDARDRRESADARVVEALSATLSESMSVREQVAQVLYECADGIPAGVTRPELVAAVNDARRRAGLKLYVRSPEKGKALGVQTLGRALIQMEREGHVDKPATARYRLSASGCQAHGLSYTDLENVDGE
jgi:hypothetical protein